MDKRQNKMS